MVRMARTFVLNSGRCRLSPITTSAVWTLRLILTFPSEHRRHPAQAIKRPGQMQLIHPPHHRQIVRFHRAGR